MLEDKISDIIVSLENELNLIRIKVKKDKKDLKHLRKFDKDSEYLDIEKIQKDKTRLNDKISEMDIRIYKLNKILYRLKVCEKILNSKE